MERLDIEGDARLYNAEDDDRTARVLLGPDAGLLCGRMMNLAWMIILTLGIFGEKVLPYGRHISLVLTWALILFGVVTLVTPWVSGPMA